jgi:hypothetical protein
LAASAAALTTLATLIPSLSALLEDAASATTDDDALAAASAASDATDGSAAAAAAGLSTYLISAGVSTPSMPRSSVSKTGGRVSWKDRPACEARPPKSDGLSDRGDWLWGTHSAWTRRGSAPPRAGRSRSRARP